jgi:2-amino-4-hydroxy-6-hydroxymethyldihydropteridine diphosphokinase
VKEVVCVALGSNLGERESHLAAALVALTRTPGISNLCVSSLWETAPVGGPGGQGAYLNAVARFETTLAPRALLDLVLELERVHGRERSVPDAPRTLDLDLLLYGGQVIREEGLTVPHPRLHLRPFVLAPLREVAADLLHPELGVSVEDLAALLECTDAWKHDEVSRQPGPPPTPR